MEGIQLRARFLEFATDTIAVSVGDSVHVVRFYGRYDEGQRCTNGAVMSLQNLREVVQTEAAERWEGKMICKRAGNAD